MRAALGVLALLSLVPGTACRHPDALAPTRSAAPTATAEANAKSPVTAPATTGAATSAGPEAWVLPVPDLGYNAREGRALFDHYCTTCHGSEGHGDGFNAYNLDPKPRDLGEAAFQAKHSDLQLAAVIRAGGPSAGLSTGMPPWGRTLNDRQIMDLVAYLRTLKPAEP